MFKLDNLKNSIINADCLKVLNLLPNKSVNFVLTDPPYQMEAHGRGLSAKRKCYKEMATYTSKSFSWFSNEFLDILCKKCVFPNVGMFGGKTDIYPFLKYAVEHKYNYFVLPICKKYPVPFCNNTWLSNEYFLYLNDRRVVCSKTYHDKIPYFLVDNKKETKHPNEKKTDVIKRIIKNLTNENDIVLDCFSGSGTVAIAALSLKRKFICIEKDPEYYKMSCDRLIEYNNKLNEEVKNEKV